jgi:hypothetical protein
VVRGYTTVGDPGYGFPLKVTGGASKTMTPGPMGQNSVKDVKPSQRRS